MIYRIYPQNNPATPNQTAAGTIFGTCAGLTLDWARNVVISQGQGLEQVTGTQPNMLRATQTQTTWAAEGANAAIGHSEVQLAQARNLGSAEQGFASLANTNTPAGVYILTLTRPADNAAHMVGVMKQDQNNFLYFEPNAGLFSCTSANEFRDFTRANCQTNLSVDPNAVHMSSRQLLNRLNQIPYPPTPALGTVPLPPHSYSPPQPQQTPSNLQPQQSTYQVPPAPRQDTVPLPDIHSYPPRPRQSTSNSQLPDTNYQPPPPPQPRVLDLPPESAPSPLSQQVSSDPRSQITEPRAAHLPRGSTVGQPQDTRRPRQRQQQLIDTQPRRTADMSTRPSRTANTATQQPEQPPSPSCCRR